MHLRDPIIENKIVLDENNKDSNKSIQKLNINPH